MMEKTKIIEFDVEGMYCGTCPDHVERALKQVAGVESVEIPGWRSNKANVVAEENVREADLLASVARAGYQAKVRSSPSLDEARNIETGHPANGANGHDFDLLVIGAGSAGFAAAIKAVDLGYRVALVGDGDLGGTCVNVGCVPSKTLIRAAAAWHSAGHHPFEGVGTKQGKLNWDLVRKQKDELVGAMRESRYADVLAAYPAIRYIEGRARFTRDGKVRVENSIYSARRYIIVTGAHPRMVNFPGAEDVSALNSTSLMDLETLPESLIILGGRAIALELGQTMARLGVNVLILQRSPRLLPEHEPDIGRAIKDYLELEGVGVITGVDIDRLSMAGDTRVVHAKVMGKEQEFRAEQILMALGREANTAGMGLAEVGVELDERGAIIVDEYQQSSNPAIYASGDVTDNPEYVYVAAAGGSVAVQNALSDERKALDLSTVPSVIFSDPQIASVGLTEAQAKREGYEVMVSKVDLSYVARAQAARDLRGFIRLLADEDTGRLLGAHIVAAEAGEVIQTATLAIKFGLTLDDIKDTLFPYLTQVEGLKLAALAFEKDLAMLSCCAV